MAKTAARQGGARARSRHAAALKDQGKRAALTGSVALSRAREAPTEPHLPPVRRRPLSPIPFFVLANSGSRIGANAGAAAGEPGGYGDGAGRAAARYGESPTRWPKPQHGKGALALARATLRLGKRAAPTCCLAPSRARRRPRPLPPLRRRPLRRFLFANFGSGAGRADAGAAAGEVGGAGDGRAAARYGESPTRWPKPQHGKGAQRS